MVQSISLTILHQDIRRSVQTERSGPRSAPERTPQRLAETTMSNLHLPVETLYHIVDHLHDTKDALRNCCLVSKSWVPRTRNHLFADIRFPTVNRLQSWKELFPDPSTSPARYAKTLSIDCAATDVGAGGWISGFSRVVHLEVTAHFHFDESATPLVPFHELSPIVKSLRVIVLALPSSQIFSLIFSFPLLEDVTVIASYETSADNGDGSGKDEIPTTTQPSSSPKFTGSLELFLGGRMKPFARRLLSLPRGIHFQKLTLMWHHEEDLSTTTALVEECSYTLKSLDITWNLGKLIQYLRPRR
jgi:hypothetical protein